VPPAVDVPAVQAGPDTAYVMAVNVAAGLRSDVAASLTG